VYICHVNVLSQGALQIQDRSPQSRYGRPVESCSAKFWRDRSAMAKPVSHCCFLGFSVFAMSVWRGVSVVSMFWCLSTSTVSLNAMTIYDYFRLMFFFSCCCCCFLRVLVRTWLAVALNWTCQQDRSCICNVPLMSPNNKR